MKKLTSFVLAAIMSLTLVACSAPAPAPTPTPEPPKVETPSPEVNPEFSPITLTDHAGREVKVEKEFDRIVSGYYITTSTLIALGLEDKVVGLEAKAKSRPIYSLAAPQLIDLPNTGSLKQFDLEGCIALKPDLVILPIKLKEQGLAMEKLGITVLLVNPETSDGLKDTIMMIGDATNTKEKAIALLDYYEGAEDNLTKIISGKDKKSVYLAGNSDILSTATAKMYQNDMISAAGGVNVSADIEDNYWATISYEKLIAYNPDVIVIVPEATYTKDDVLNNEKLKSLNAVKNKQVYAMPSKFEAWDSPVPSSVLGKLWLASVLFEDAYSFDTFKADAVKFYDEFYGFSANADDITK